MRRAAAVALALALAAGEARAGKTDAIEACVSAAREGQRAQRQGKLHDAHDTFLGCIKPECPSEVRSVCEQLLSKVEASQPTLILAARDGDGHDLLAVRVLADDALFTPSLDGKALPIDPGPHVLRFEREGGGPAVTVDVVVRESEKNRAVSVDFPSEKRATLTAPPAPKKEEPRGSPSPLAFVLAGASVVAVGAFTYLDLRGQSTFDDCRADRCSAKTVDALSLQRALAFVFLGVAAISAGAATWMFLSPPRAPGTSASAR